MHLIVAHSVLFLAHGLMYSSHTVWLASFPRLLRRWLAYSLSQLTHMYMTSHTANIIVCGFKILQFAKFHKNWYSQILVQFCSFRFDLITEEILHLQYIGGFHAGPASH